MHVSARTPTFVRRRRASMASSCDSGTERGHLRRGKKGGQPLSLLLLLYSHSERMQVLGKGVWLLIIVAPRARPVSLSSRQHDIYTRARSWM
ncbi:hypothetical protein A0H81_00533 [Grifola frondosa]|uniref:Uncharacterized protein n=1 Tax=Grifola frondosa TaxID=5627 RepID=A0A1C7MQ93_GRIFR|nr:hypothetical protein A0H81_00533 [Grifola frondosa]